MSPQNSASHLRLPRTQACFPRPIVFFCLGDGISLTASAYRGIRSNANSADRNVTHNLVHSCYPFCSFSRPIVFFCLGDGISLTASAYYRGITSNANLQLGCHYFTKSPADVTTNLCFSSKTSMSYKLLPLCRPQRHIQPCSLLISFLLQNVKQ